MALTTASPAVKPWAAMGVLGFGTVISHGFGLALVPAMLPRISDDFGVGYGVLGSVTAIGLVAYAAAALAAGRIADRLPSRRLLVATYVVGGLALLGAGASTSPPVLALAVMAMSAAAPVSWAVTLHIAGEAVRPSARAMVMAGAGSGAALGVLINGVLVQTSADLHSWRVSFVIAATLALIPIAGSLATFRSPLALPHTANGGARSAYRRVLATRPGRIVVAAGLVAGVAGFPFGVFLTATAIDEVGVSALAAGALWWVIGALGTVAGPVFGRHGDRTTPMTALTVGAVAYAAGLVALAAVWGYAGLLVAAIGYALMNYPVWGLVGAVANRHFDSSVAVRAVSLGLVAASGGGAVAAAVTGAWIDATESFRGPAVVIAAVAVALAAWYLSVVARGGLDPAEQTAPPVAYDP